ncbi:DUF3293 domain-containing protein [Sediminicoccus rosea]|uniref:DUF3293 domain-containing protein n=1 Tax=Sediminicoccus rosea TaxID=1225128 RepID=A0ABZ0PP29_9PROT|nr:DUF3293 domain-containing protein [Sediminicoccus rosea]WPB87132.1 DUF3293 domain-containing protein [Sediminicoccus rosea]
MTRAEAYRRTQYRAGEVVVRVGRRSATADRWMARHGAREAGFITAWNPMSRRMPPAWNAAAQARLRRDLRGAGREEGEGALGAWHEAMLLVALPKRVLARLARRHRQAAVVWLRRGRPARLLDTRPG